MSFIITKFHEILLIDFKGLALTNCFSSIFHFGQMSKLEKGVIPRKKMNVYLQIDLLNISFEISPGK